MIEHQDAIDFTHVPQSQGLGRGTIVILVIGLLAIFTMGGLSAFLSGWGHLWPSTTTLRMPLGNMPK
ncbi:MAG TPA: hypothetical protein VK702_06560 [Candidatus Acidoferrum sp.]|jgi:hypothetical protein|nr:hypothetical protein [Candidatus Acidoferrum sp.]